MTIRDFSDFLRVHQIIKKLYSKGKILGSRRKSRESAIQMLYQLEMNPTDIDSAFSLFWETLDCPDDIKEFTELLVKGVMEHKEEIDNTIIMTAKNWSLQRINPIDRSILREAIFEIMFLKEIPVKATINEAIEMAKKFGTEKSGSFINGILDNIKNKHEKGKVGNS